MSSKKRGSTDMLLLYVTSLFSPTRIAHRFGFSFGESHHNTSLFGTLYIALVIATNSIPYGNKVEARLIKYVVVSCSNLKQPFGKAVIEMLLLSGVV